MKIIQEISTHKAVKTATGIDIIEKGFKDEVLNFPERKLYTIPLENEDDVFAIMEDFEETNRCLVAEFKAEMAIS